MYGHGFVIQEGAFSGMCIKYTGMVIDTDASEVYPLTCLLMDPFARLDAFYRGTSTYIAYIKASRRMH